MSDPLKYKIQLLDWMILNLLIGNSDGHGKNISFMRSPNGFVVAPWYDLLNIRPELPAEITLKPYGDPRNVMISR